jgi:hypothetical protein
MTYKLKLVPDSDPNAPGEWVDYSGSEKPTYDTVVRAGWHVVQIISSHEDRSGESMHMTAMRNIHR